MVDVPGDAGKGRMKYFWELGAVFPLATDGDVAIG